VLFTGDSHNAAFYITPRKWSPYWTYITVTDADSELKQRGGEGHYLKIKKSN
jgi:hypothetical protein